MAKLLHIKKSDYCAFFCAAFLPAIIFATLFQLWNFNLSQLLFEKNEDVLSVVFAIKTIIHSGWYFSNDMVSFPHIKGPFYLHDFPVHADFLNFALVKFLTYFSSDPFLILNIFFILTFSLVSSSSFVVLRYFKIENFSAILVSILFAFTPYHFFRNTMHLFLSNYMVIPLVIMIALWIIDKKISLTQKNQKGQFYISPNKFFVIASSLCLVISGTGIYYALYACIIFVLAFALSYLKTGSFFNQTLLVTSTLCAFILLTLIILHIPSFIYWIENGVNSFIVQRPVEDIYNFSLKIIYLFLPIENHFIPYFSELTKSFNKITLEMEAPSEHLGILAASGLLFSLIWLLSSSYSENKNSVLQKTVSRLNLKKSDQIFISELSSLNLLIILFATIGGFMMLIALPFPILRSHARFTIFIAFLSFFIIAIIFDQLIKNSNHKKIIQIFVAVIALIALLDQTGIISTKYVQNEQDKQQNIIEKDFVKEIEASMPKNSIIFQLPLISFPEGQGYQMVKGYLYSDKLRWSYPAIEGRESSIWQKKVSSLDFKDFIKELKNAKFSGIYINKRVTRIICEWNYFEKCQTNSILKLENQLKKVAKKSLISKDYQLVFFEI